MSRWTALKYAVLAAWAVGSGIYGSLLSMPEGSDGKISITHTLEF